MSIKTLLTALTIISFTACVNPGKEVKFNNKNKIYVKDGATEDDAKKLGPYMEKIGYFLSDEKERAIQLTKEGSQYIIKLVVDTAALRQHPELASTLRELGPTISKEVFSGSATVVKLIDPELKEVKQ